MTMTIDTNGDPLHLGLYPAYSGLWHLHHLELLPAAEGQDSPLALAEKAGGPRVRVALIDTPVAWQHPCLKDVIAAPLMIDFAAETAGAFVQADDPDGLRTGLRDPDLLSVHKDQPWEAEARSLHERLAAEDTPAHPGRAAAAPAHGAHGTAMAGLIGARPARIRVHDASRRSPDPRPAETPEVVLPYCGVNPFCEIVPISTSADPDPAETIRALIYADFIRADIIVLATSLPPPSVPPARAATVPVTTLEEAQVRQATLEKLFHHLGGRVPIFCAAGNHGGDTLSYPASLAQPTNAIVAVGALNALGFPCVYTPRGPGISVLAPSGDDERIARDAAGGYDVRLDHWQRQQNRADDAVLFAHATTNQNLVPPEGIVTTDVPGPFGYNPSPYLRASYVPEAETGEAEEEVFLDPAHLLGMFSGTSAATAIAAGFAALAMTAGKVARPHQPGFQPDEIKRRLVAKAAGPAADAPASDRLVWPAT